MGTEESEKGATYAEAGVDIMNEGRAIRGLVSALKYRREGFGAQVDIGGHFTGIVEFGEHYLSLCTDGVGSKILIAEQLQKWDTIGIDCMAMNANDMICIGAEPIAFVDYIATENPDPAIMEQVGKGLDEGARQANLTIIGGETASLPEIVDGLDLAGTCLGFVKKGSVITGQNTVPGDVIIGLPSSGLHSNGFSLVRRIVEMNDLSYISPLDEIVSRKEWKAKSRYPHHMETVERWARSEGARILGEILLTPTRIYVNEIMELLGELPMGSVHAMANITGGGFRNLARVREGLRFVIDEPLDVHPVFRLVQVLGSVDEKEMYQTFNMGMGLCIIVDPSVQERVLEVLRERGARKVGKVVSGTGVFIEGPDIEYPGYV